jgi:WhiB family transcriptional regulator, redox-sensing transcriptional regulator
MITPPPAWTATAPCKPHRTLFYPVDGEAGGARTKRQRQAIAICNTCPHINACRDYADSNDEVYGVWAGEVRHSKKRYVPEPLTTLGRVKVSPCGTYRGYLAHINNHNDPCATCIDAWQARRQYKQQHRKIYQPRANAKQRERRQRIKAELTEVA